jgi:hypothetical protein
MRRDGDAGGTVNDGDYLFWRNRFGNNVPGAVGNLASVPEPSTALLTLIALAPFVARKLTRSRVFRIEWSNDQ